MKSDLIAQQPKEQMPTATTLSAYQSYADEAGEMSQRIKFKHGDWIFAEDDKEVPTDETFVVNVSQTWREWIKWKDQEPIERKIVYISSGEPFPEREDLGDLDQDLWDKNGNGEPQDPWQEQHGFTMRSLTSGEEYVCSFSSNGGIRAIQKLVGEFRFQIYVRNKVVFPHVRLSQRKYYNKRHKVEVECPVFAVLGWTSMGELPGGAKANAELNDPIPF
jgi:hypothetical protein